MRIEILEEILDTLNALCIVYDSDNNIVYPKDDSMKILKIKNILNNKSCNSDIIYDNEKWYELGSKDVCIDSMSYTIVTLKDITYYKYNQLKNEIDYTTNIFNKKAFFEKFNLYLEKIAGKNIDFTVFIGDIDYFKKINDSYGHLSGDYILSQIGNIIKSNFNCLECFCDDKEDSINKTVLGRFGGEEFVGLITGLDMHDSFYKVESLREKIQNYDYSYDKKNPNVTMSFGICNCNGIKIDKENISSVSKELIKKADSALYTSKNNGRNKTTVYNR